VPAYRIYELHARGRVIRPARVLIRENDTDVIRTVESPAGGPRRSPAVPVAASNPPPARPGQRITAGDSRESPTRICKKTAAKPRNSGKSAPRNSSDHPCPIAVGVACLALRRGLRSFLQR
jgi:hypothetical protein